MYETKEAAEKDAKFTKVNFSEDDWFAAIGLKEGMDRLEYDEECELPPCCANISDIRNALEEVRSNKGLIERHRCELQDLLNQHPERPTRKQAPKLYRILDTIGVNWK
jgi:hypothetical protein